MDNDQAPLSQALREAIIRRNLSAYSLAKRAGVSPVVVQRFISGERGLTLETVDKIAAYLGLQLRDEEAVPLHAEGEVSRGGPIEGGVGEPEAEQATRLVFSRKIGDKIVLDGHTFLSVESIAGKIVKWKVRRDRPRKVQTFASHVAEEVPLPLGDGISLCVIQAGKTTLRLVLCLPRGVTAHRYEIFRSMQVSESDESLSHA